MVNENRNPAVASTSSEAFLRCKSFAKLPKSDTMLLTPIKVIPSSRIQYDNSTDEQSQENSKSASKPRKRRKRKGRADNGQEVLSDEDYEPVEKRKTPRKRGQPPLKFKYHKISDFFSKTTERQQVAKTPPRKSLSPKRPIALSEVIVLSSSEEELPKKPPTRSVQKQKATTTKRRQCPEYKMIDGTHFAVDAFNFGEIAGVSTYFLTHFHGDHYVGLTKNFNKPLCMSKITGRLVQSILKVNPKFIKTLDINTSYFIDDVEVIAIDANHCPGAVMFIFKLKNGRVILHTGDFRATPEMESNPVFWNNVFHSVYLDTTYLHKSYDFASQFDTLCYVEDEVRKFKEKNIGMKFLIVVGSYTIGKERVWCHIAQSFQMKVWLDPERRKTINLIYSDENKDQRITGYLTNKAAEAQLHVLPLQCINYSYLIEYVKDFEDHNLLAFRPSGWEKNSKPQYGSKISIVGVQYSEHSSYKELERFVRFIRPEKVISTVPKSSSNPNITQKIPNKWLLNETKPMTYSCQSTITTFMKLQKNVPAITSNESKSTKVTSGATRALQNSDENVYASDDTDFMI